MVTRKKLSIAALAIEKDSSRLISGVHADCINVEVWNIHPDFNLSDANVIFEEIPEEAFIGNAELELSIKNAEELISCVQEAIVKAKRGR